MRQRLSTRPAIDRQRERVQHPAVEVIGEPMQRGRPSVSTSALNDRCAGEVVDLLDHVEVDESPAACLWIVDGIELGLAKSHDATDVSEPVVDETEGLTPHRRPYP